MYKKLTLIVIGIVAAVLSAATDLDAITREKFAMKTPNDTGSYSPKLPYSAVIGNTFGQSTNGYGWILSTTRKVQTNLDPTTGTMVGSIYRKYDTVTGSGTIGGMTGNWGASFQGYAQTVYNTSIYSTNPDLKPGGRYPYANEFINGYFFATFNDMDLGPNGAGISTTSQPMFTVADATLGYELAMWSEPKRIEATEGGAVIPAAWTGEGDVVYDPVTGYYYWTVTFGETLNNTDLAINSIAVGKSLDPANPDSWVWTDYHELRFDATDDTVGSTNIGDFHIAYCKDIQGYGTGKGIAVSMMQDVNDFVTVDGTDVAQNWKLSYMYTTNWGLDESTGDLKSNWIKPGEDMLFQLEGKDIFDWYGEQILDLDSIGIDSLTNEIIWDTLGVVTMNDIFIQTSLSAVATENNNVHVMLRVWPASLDNPGSYYTMTDSGFRGGWYHLKGTITDTGVTWGKAKYVASFIDNDIGEHEYKYYNSNNMSIGYAGTIDGGNEVIYMSWLDKPASRATLATQTNPLFDTDNVYNDDAYFVTSSNGGLYWDIASTKDVESGDPANPIWKMYFGTNLTKTGNLHEQGWSVAQHGSMNGSTITVYGAHQYYDPATPTVDPIDDYACYLQNLKVWKITGTVNPSGIEAEEVSMVKDFRLLQNYPNPFNPSTEIRFALANDSNVKLSVFNTKGELVANLKNGAMAKGSHAVTFDASALNSGVYFYKLDVNGMSETRKMVLTK
ncbi:MAG TPA: T9SS type A sorting domain-containing protein [Clostridiales bacterium]|nr:T9SS type A sorting domain-containing protein [Clostridiales bacterium]